MHRPAAFSATYSDWKLVRTRKVVQVIFEVPLEAADEALKVLGGMPDSSAERWFGIAPLKAEAAKPEKSKQNWRDLPPATQAVLRCNDAPFRAFLTEQKGRELGYEIHTEEYAAIAVRELCGVKSRSELSTNHAARVLWHGLDSEYQGWLALERAS